MITAAVAAPELSAADPAIRLDKEYRVFGPPGTGKTTYIQQNIAAACQKYAPWEIVAVSFTNMAAEELSSRNLGIPGDNCGTLHSLAYRGIYRPPVTESHIKEWGAYAPQYTLRGAEENEVSLNGKGEGDKLLNMMEVYRNKLVPRELWPSSLRHFANTWEAWKLENGYVDFSDMIELAIESCPQAPGNPQVGFFDEVQDFTPLELRLVRQWTESMDRVVLAGDDDQALYAFRGALPDAFLNPPLPQEHKRVLRQSFRVPRQVLEYSQKWIKRLTVREPKEYLPRDCDGELRRRSDITWKRPEPLLPLIEEAIAQDRTVMILGSCSYMLAPLVQVLKKKGIPFHNPYTRSHREWNPLAESYGHGVSTIQRLLAFLRPMPEVWGEGAGMWSGEDLNLWASMLKSTGVFVKEGRAFEGKKRMEALKRSLHEVPIDALLTIFEQEALASAMDLDTEWLLRMALATKAPALHFPLTVMEKRGPDALREKPKCVIGTIHSVKGGEATDVYFFPDLSGAGMNAWMGRGELRDAVVRLFYVAMTRSRETLTLCAPSSRYCVEGL